MKLTTSKASSATAKLSLMAVAVVACSGALADDKGWYLGANVGQTQATIDDARITSGLLGSGLSSIAISDINRDLGYKIFGGYQFNKSLALEGGYFDLGQFGFVADTSPAGSLNGQIALRGVNLDVVGTLPITERFSVFGRIGAAYTEAQDSFSGTGNVHVLNPDPSSRSTNLKLGMGVQYAMTDNLALRAEIERYRIDDAVGNKGDVDLASLGLVYRFGAKAPIPVAREMAAAPMPVAAAQPPMTVSPPPPLPPTPAPRPAPPPPPPIKTTFSADSLFDFDKSVVKPAGRAELNKFATDLKGMDYQVISVTGHTDRIGSHAYNQKLSERRASAVKTYLVESASVSSGKISARGVDGAEPVTKPGDCVGKKTTPALIACLQPDRRVEIEVTGNR
ncbi:MAG: OmpA family protein [Rhodoferax sp.]|jgi:OOP family OmpA-OmpF porin|nr:OmpA family protein [Rhodoferax sp.]